MRKEHYHKIWYPLEKKSKTNRILAKCKECPYEIWVEEGGKYFIGHTCRCHDCDRPFKVDDIAAELDCHLCDPCRFKYATCPAILKRMLRNVPGNEVRDEVE